MTGGDGRGGALASADCAHASEALYRALMDHAHDAIIMGDVEQRVIIDANRRACDMLGRSREQMVGMPVMEMHPPELRESYGKLFDEHVAHGGSEAVELVMRHRDGGYIPVAVSVAVVEIGGRRVIQGIFRDIREQRQNEHALKASEKSLKSVVEGLPVPTAVIRVGDGKLLYVNAMATALLAVSAGESSDFRSEDFYWDAADRGRVLDLIAAHGRMQARELRLKRADGTPFWAEISAQPILYDEQQALLTILIDIDERKRAEMQIREDAAFRETLIESAAEGICMWQRVEEYPHVRFVVWNQRMREITGYSMQQINELGWYQTMYPSSEAQTRAQERMEAVESGGRLQGAETEVVAKSGNVRSLRISSVSLALEEGENWVLAVMEDVTEQREVEANLRQMQKIEALGTLVGGIAHDFNNILTGMLGNIYLAQSDAEDSPGLLEKLQVAEELGFRAADLISQLLTFARKGRVNMQSLELNAYIRDIFGKRLLSLPENIRLRNVICDESLPVRGDVTQLQQVLMNLLANARDALQGCKAPEVEVRLQRFVPDGHFRRAHAGRIAPAYALLSIADNGEGIPSQNMERIFEPFFTTKDVGEGSGLGLAMVYSIVQGHGGFVEVESTPHAGTTFHIYLPLSDGSAHAPAPVVAGGVPKGHGELILLADDEPDVRRSVAEVVERLGYRVLTAGDGEVAWALFQAHRQDIALAILDVVMPGISGTDLAQRMRQDDPRFPVLLATGYDAGGDLARFGGGVVRVLAKPFRIDELGREIHRCLEGDMD